MKVSELFYKVKYKNNKKHVRFLCFRFEEPLPPQKPIPAAKPVTPHFILPPPFQDRNKIQVSSNARLTLSSWNVKNIGNYSYTNPDLICQSSKTTIGSFCSIGPRVVLGHGKHPISYLSTSPYFYFEDLDFMDFSSVPKHQEFWDIEPIHIGNDVWIGDGVFVKNGVTIGDGAIVGARAVVTKDVPPYSIVVGTPAKVIKYRFSQEVIEELLELKWWDLDVEILRKCPYENIDVAIKYLKEMKNR